MFLEELRIASDTIACNALPLLCDWLAFAFLLVLYAYVYRALGLGWLCEEIPCTILNAYMFVAISTRLCLLLLSF